MSMLLTICALHFIAQLSPGPDVLLVAKSAASTTRSNTLKIVFGITVGIVVWVMLTLLGFTVLIEQFPWIQQVLMIIGGFFLAKMGYAISLLKHPYQVIDFYKCLDPILNEYTSKSRYYIEKAYYRQAKLKPSLIYQHLDNQLSQHQPVI